MSNYSDAFGRPRRFGLAETAADMAAPAAENLFVHVEPYPEALWYVRMGANVTSYSVSTYRWSNPEDGKMGTAFAVLEDTFTGNTGNAVFRQPAWGDGVSLRIHAIVNPDGAFEVRLKGINPQ